LQTANQFNEFVYQLTEPSGGWQTENTMQHNQYSTQVQLIYQYSGHVSQSTRDDLQQIVIDQ
jgi:hypothetical protein